MNFLKKFLIILMICFIVGCNNKNVVEIVNKNGDTVKLIEKDFDGFSLMIPAKFSIMSRQMMAIKYPNKIGNSTVYTNEDVSVNVSINKTGLAIKNDKLLEYIDQFKNGYNKTGTVVKDSVLNIDNRLVWQLEFVSKTINSEIYNKMIFFEDKGYLIIVSFNCPEEQKEEWELINEYIINSLKFDE